MARFNLEELLKNQTPIFEGVSDPDTGREQIEYIDLDQLEADPNNFYHLSGIEELANNIQLVKLQQPIRVRPGENGRFIIVSGHRRRAALQLLVEEGCTEFRSVPCIREVDEVSPAMRELRLIYANNDTRKMTDADIAKQAERVKDLLYQLKEEGIEFPGRMRDYVAEACQISKTKLARLNVITKGLIPEYRAEFDAGNMPEATAYTMARMPEGFQRRIHKVAKRTPDSYTLEQILKDHEDGTRWEPAFTCPDNQFPCNRGDSFLRHDLENRWSMCGGNKCCMDCHYATASVSPCERACPKAKALKKEKVDKEKAAEEKRKAKFQKELRKQIAHSVRRIVIAADQAGLEDSVKLRSSLYNKEWTVGELRRQAEGEFGDAYFCDNEWKPSRLQNLVGLSRLLHCSTDYLLELTEEPTQGGVSMSDTWDTGLPDKTGLYWGIIGPMNGGGRLYWWNNEARRWEHPGTVMELTPSISCWMPCPDLPDGLTWNRTEV